MHIDAPDLSDEAVVAWARLVRVSQTALSNVESDLKAAKYPPLAWYDALLELERARPEGLRPFQLQQRMLLAQYNLSRLLDRLEMAGYINRQACADDGRGHRLQITRQGSILLRRMWPIYRAAIAKHFAGRLGAKDAAKLAQILGKLR